MTQYLYGAKVQGIQSYIFETNRLQDIAGASELIESLSGEEGQFKDLFNTVGASYNSEQLIRNAAGEISYLFKDKESCAAVVKHFEQYIASKMPGLSVSQAVVKVTGDENLVEDSRKVQRKLQEQRNRPSPPAELGWMISERARRTGRPGVDFAEKDGLIDRRQQTKRAAAKGDRLYEKLIGKDQPYGNNDFAFNLEDICHGGDRAWLAVVHADGNNLGKLIQKLIPDLPKGKTKEGYRKFSETLEKATVAAAQTAYREVLAPVVEAEAGNLKRRLPIRPVVIGGDDLTVILRAEHAVSFTQTYLAAFEAETKKQFGEYAKELQLSKEVQAYFANGLTACAGIAIVKPKYPFHYAAELSEELCGWTKKIVKAIDKDGAPSALHFHKVQASFVQDYKDIIEQELTTIGGKRLTAGPYFVGNPPAKAEGFHRIDDLLGFMTTLKKKTSPAGPLRNYVGELRVNEAAAAQQLDRIRGVNKPEVAKELALGEEQIFRKRTEDSKEIETTHLYDPIQLANL